MVWQFQAIKQADVRKAEEGGRRVAEEAPRKEAKAKYNLAEADAMQATPCLCARLQSGEARRGEKRAWQGKAGERGGGGRG